MCERYCAAVSLLFPPRGTLGRQPFIVSLFTMPASLLGCAHMFAPRMIGRRLLASQLPCRWLHCRSAIDAPHPRPQAADARPPAAGGMCCRQTASFAAWGRSAAAIAGRSAASRCFSSAAAVRCSALAGLHQQADGEPLAAAAAQTRRADAEQAAADALAAWIRAIEPQPAQLAPRRIPGRGGCAFSTALPNCQRPTKAASKAAFVSVHGYLVCRRHLAKDLTATILNYHRHPCRRPAVLPSITAHQCSVSSSAFAFAGAGVWWRSSR